MSSSLETRAQHTYNAGRVIYNGQGLQQTGGLPSITLSFNWLSAAEWTWFATTILNGERSRVLDTFDTKLYNDDFVLTTYSSCVIHKPTFEEYKNGYRRNVEVRITALVAA